MMPLRPVNREQAWLLPPSLDDLLPEDHSARFVAAFVDGLDRNAWAEMEIDIDGDPLGAPAYDPQALLSVWLYGFMTGVRSSRKLEAACRDQIPFLWLTGWQHPDHNTLWRFYQAHRSAMRSLLKHTVRTAVEVGLVDLAVQAVDGTKIAANAAGDRTYDMAGLARLLARTEAAIGDLEAHNERGDDPPPPRLPAELQQTQALRERIQDAMNNLAQDQSLRRVNLTDGDAQLMKGRQGIMPGYNAQAVVSPLDPAKAKRSGLLITAADVTTTPNDYDQLAPMLGQAEEMTGARAEMTLADGGYHSGPNLHVCDERGQQIVMPEGQREAMKGPYFKDRFEYDRATDSYICPHGQSLIFRGFRRHKQESGMRVYRASGAVCRACPAFGICTKDRRWGRVLWISPHDCQRRVAFDPPPPV
jgi:transposase